MALYAEAKETFTLAPQGQFQAVCCEILDLGFVNRIYKNKDTGVDEARQNHEIQYVFQLNNIDPENGKRFEIRSQPFNLILSEKASLRKFLLGWRGHDLTEAEKLPPGVNVDLTGRNAIISVVHNKSGDKTFANIGAIMPLMAGMPEIGPLDYQSKKQAATMPMGQSMPLPQGQQIAVDAIPF
jgi:hypothetical protein